MFDSLDASSGVNIKAGTGQIGHRSWAIFPGLLIIQTSWVSTMVSVLF